MSFMSYRRPSPLCHAPASKRIFFQLSEVFQKGSQKGGRGRVKWVFFYLENFKLEIEMTEMNLELHSRDYRGEKGKMPRS